MMIDANVMVITSKLIQICITHYILWLTKPNINISLTPNEQQN